MGDVLRDTTSAARNVARSAPILMQTIPENALGLNRQKGIENKQGNKVDVETFLVGKYLKIREVLG
jgi:hypothetical protein